MVENVLWRMQQAAMHVAEVRMQGEQSLLPRRSMHGLSSH